MQNIEFYTCKKFIFSEINFLKVDMLFSFVIQKDGLKDYCSLAKDKGVIKII